MTIRNNNIRTADVIPEEKLERQLKLTQEKIQGVSESDLSYLRGMTDSQGKRMFREETLSFLRDFKLPEFHMKKVGNNYQLEFE